ncbi:MAG: hypothetical protein JWN84_3110, partial [Nocardioides sp.]|nr:hypothetical protein [Nocardioides sp.]
MSSLVAPPGWPAAVRPPDAPRWELTAESWLLDISPPEFRSYPTLRRHVVLLALFALRHDEGMQTACHRGLREARADLRDVAPPDVVDEAVQTWLSEDARLSGLRREVGLVEDALR